VSISLATQGGRAPGSAAFIGELALDGAVRHVDGVLVVARGLRAHGITDLFVPPSDAAEAALAKGVQVHPAPSLGSVITHLTGDTRLEPYSGALPVPVEVTPEVDLREVHGQEAAKRALEIAAAGGHHLLMWGPPGAGKTMLARCLPDLLPPLELEEALEVAQVRSVLGELPGGYPLDWRRPFRSPHHSISLAGLVGGGSGFAHPGEVSRATNGVLFLDELAEFQAGTLQALRQPLEQGRIVVTRSGGSVAYPARFQLVAATNPCPCGWAGDGRRACRCSQAVVDSYQHGLSGPLLDRIDL
jgi:magnesium chelatase family protein